jgi:hypothetical protein
MTLENWAALAEIIGALAVVVTLVYLAIQVRQNTGAIRSSNATSVQINVQSLAQGPIMDRELGGIILRAVADEGELEPAEKLAAYAWFYNMLKIGELAHQFYLRGELDKSYWEASLGFFVAYWQTPGFKRYWVDRKGAFTPIFRSAVEEWMNQSESPVTRSDKLYGAPEKRGS